MKISLHMEKLAMLLSVGLLGIFLASCGDDEKPQTEPVVTTAVVSDITTSSAKGGGEITSDGNSTITASGLAYSAIVTQPIISDQKTTTTTTSGTFTSLMEGLTSGTTYHVRAYATNGVGTSYGEVVSFVTGNKAPEATDLSIDGTAKTDEELTAVYSYNDAEGDLQGESTFKWYVATSSTGAGETVIEGKTASTYVVRDADATKYIRFGVTPKAATGSTIGVEVKSAFIGPVGEDATVTFTYNKGSVTYGIINSAETGRRWLDRNLGASNVASKVDDYANYGDLFQWGRGDDGHQLVIRGGLGDANMASVNSAVGPFPTSTVSVDDPGHSNFIAVLGTAPVDWRNPQNNNLWQGVLGTNNPCPSGWRLATKEEWAAEKLTNLADGYTKLKLTYTGVKAFDYGDFYQSTTNGNYWTSTIGTTDPTQSFRINLSATENLVELQVRAQAFACRCIKDNSN